MIPVAPLPLIVPLIYLSSFVAGIWLLVWLSLLALSPHARHHLTLHRQERGVRNTSVHIPRIAAHMQASHIPPHHPPVSSRSRTAWTHVRTDRPARTRNKEGQGKAGGEQQKPGTAE